MTASPRSDGQGGVPGRQAHSADKVVLAVPIGPDDIVAIRRVRR